MKTFENGAWVGEGEMPIMLTDEERSFYEGKASQLAVKNSVSKVHPIVQIEPETLERRVCYLKEPNYMTKLAVMDKAISIGPYMAGEELRIACILTEDSDAITYGDSSECDRYKLGVVDYCILMVRRLQDQFKKK